MTPRLLWAYYLPAANDKNRKVLALKRSHQEPFTNRLRYGIPTAKSNHKRNVDAGFWGKGDLVSAVPNRRCLIGRVPSNFVIPERLNLQKGFVSIHPGIAKLLWPRSDQPITSSLPDNICRVQAWQATMMQKEFTPLGVSFFNVLR